MSTAADRVQSSEVANTAWYVWKAEHAPRGDYPPDMLLELREAFIAGFGRGARYSFVESAKLAPAIAALADFLEWLRAA